MSSVIGKIGTAPCGHRGEYVTANYIKCLQGCDAIPEYIEPEKTQPYPTSSRVCAHPGASRYSHNGAVFCGDCGKLLRSPGGTPRCLHTRSGSTYAWKGRIFCVHCDKDVTDEVRKT